MYIWYVSHASFLEEYSKSSKYFEVIQTTSRKSKTITALKNLPDLQSFQNQFLSTISKVGRI